MSFGQLRQNNELPKARISTDFLSTLLRKQVFAYDYLELPLKNSGSQMFFFGKLECHRFCGEKRNTSKLSARVRFAVTHDAEGFNKRVLEFASEDTMLKVSTNEYWNSPVKIKKQTLFFACESIKTIFKFRPRYFLTYLLTLYIRLFLRLLNKKCGTFGQLQYYANNFDDFFVSIFIVLIVFHRKRMTFLFIHSR